ncbi:MAG: cell wall-active antibiotics response protein LiaF [Sporolactobacillus sp.]
MFRSLKKDKFSWILIAVLLALVVQSVFGDWGFLFPAVLFAALLYYGRKNLASRRGKILFWIGLIGLVIIILSTFLFKIVIIFLFVLFLVDFIQSKKNPLVIRPERFSAEAEKTVESDTLLQNRWFGHQATPGQDYEWHDINIQVGAGDTLIDLSRTILPRKEAVILIRQLAGRVRILIPFGVETSVRYSVGLGQLDFFDHKEARLINESVAFQTKHYLEGEQKIAIIVSAVAGSLEVRRT